MVRRSHFATTALAAAFSAQAPAQPLGYDYEVALGPLILPDQPAATSDPDADRLLLGLRGTFRSSPKSDPAIEFRAVPLTVEGLDNATYFEIARQDSPWAPFRQGVIHTYRRQGKLTLRIFDIGAPSGPGAGLRDAVAGLSAAPDVFPPLKAESLVPNLDLAVTIGGGMEKDITASTPHPFPTTRAGAVEMTSMLGVWSNGRLLVFADRGFAADGTQVWGPVLKEDVRLTRLPHTEGAQPTGSPTVNRLEGGLVTIDTVSGEGPGLETGGSAVLQYSFWLTDGTLIDTSRRAGREPLRTQVPGTPIKGFDAGMLGMAKGGRRRIVIPPDLGYGKSGARANIPPDSTLIFDVECLWLQNPAAPPSPIAPEVAPTPAPPQPNPAPPPAPK